MKSKRLNELRSIARRALAVLREQVEDLMCPLATQDIAVNTKNRNLTRDEHAYGPMNPLEPSEEYWEALAEKWEGATADEAKGMRCGNCVAFDVSDRMKACMPISDEQIDPEDAEEIDVVDEELVGKPSSDFPGLPEDMFVGFGYCWMHHFKCHSARSCDTWAGGGPIDEDEQSAEWQEKSAGAGGK
jgi:hypothetical protein